MARIAGINLPNQKHIWVALTSIFGIGHTRARDVCTASGVSPVAKVKDLTDAEVESAISQLRRILQQQFNAKLR